MTMKMASLQPEEIITDSKEAPDEMIESEDDVKANNGPVSPDGVDGLSPGADENDESENECESDDESESESEEEDEVEEEQVEELSAADLLAFTKSRLQKEPERPPTVAEPTPTDADDDEDEDEDEDAVSDDENENSVKDEDAGSMAEEGAKLDSKPPASELSAINSAHSEEKKTDADAIAPNADADEPEVKDQDYYIQLAMKKTKEAEAKALADAQDPEFQLAMKKTKEAEAKALADEQDADLELALQKTREAEAKARADEDPAYLMKLAEEKVKQANAKAKDDEEHTSENVIKPALSAKPTRNENQELWALLNYSKRRLETGSTPQLGKKSSSKSGSKNNSVRGDDNMSVSSKLSRSSKRSLGSRKSVTIPVSVEGGPGDLRSPLGSALPDEDKEAEKMDALFHNVTDQGNASVDGSVSLESDAKNEEDADESENSGDDESESSDEEEEEEDELPDFLKDDNGETLDPESTKMLYEAAKFKAASILSVSEEKLTDVQMLQAIAIAEEAAKKGDEKFSTKRSLFKLNEAKVEDLKNFLNIGVSTPRGSAQALKREEKEQVGWGIGRGRFIKKMGLVINDFKEKCNEIDDKKTKEREGQPSTKEILSAGMLDLKAQIEEYEKIVTAKQGKS